MAGGGYANFLTGILIFHFALLLDHVDGSVAIKRVEEYRVAYELIDLSVVAAKTKKMDDTFVVSQYAQGMEPDKMLLIAGEKLTLRELLDGIFLVSANDAAEVLAEQTTGDRDEFIKLMNDKASQLGMKDTHFVNPTGLDEDENNSYKRKIRCFWSIIRKRIYRAYNRRKS